MENRKYLYDNLLDSLVKKVPKKSELVNIVTDTLRIEKESAYRRLRGEIPFTLNEAGAIASRMGISMDELIYRNGQKKPSLTYMALPLDSSMEDYDYESLKLLIKSFKEISFHANSEHGMAVNTLPATLYLNLKNLTRFLFFKWSHRYEDPGAYLRYNEIILSDQGLRLQNELGTYMHKIDKTICIIDEALIGSIIKDLRYYMTIRYISSDEADALLSDLVTLIDDIERIAQYGRFPDTGNKFELYLSGVNIGTSYNYASGGHDYVSSFTTFVIQPAVSYQKETYLKVKDWVYYLRRMSTLISVVGVKERMEFLDRQRRLIDELHEEYSRPTT